jgi:DHA1 family bicyclomycin/chloramphenicol resistance-like MFS transporter
MVGQTDVKSPLLETDCSLNLKWYHMVILLSFGSFAVFASDAYFAVLETVKNDLNTTVLVTSLSVQMNWILGAIFGSILGWMSDRIGRRKSAILSVCLFLAGCVGCALSPNVELFLISRFFQGVGQGGSTITYAVIRDVENDTQKRVQRLGALSSAISITVVIAPTIGGIIGNYFGWRVLFYFIAIWGATTLAGFVFVFPETLAPREERNESLGLKYLFRRLLKDDYYLLCVALVSLDLAAIYSLLANIPFIYSDYYGFSTLQVSLALSAIPLFGSLAAFVSSQLSKSLPVTTLMKYALIWMFVASAPLSMVLILKLYTYSSWVMIGASMLFGTIVFFNIPILHGMMVENLKSISGFAEGTGAMISNVFGVGVSLLSSFLYNGNPSSMLIAVLGSVAAAEIVFWLVYVLNRQAFETQTKSEAGVWGYEEQEA